MPVDVQSGLAGAATGATIGSVVPGIGTAVGAVAGGLIGIAPSLFKMFSGANQKNKANQINPYNPGYQMNQGILNNQRIISDRYNNYTLPGYTQAQNNINNTYQNAYSQGVQGASSGGDVADLAAKLAYGKNIAENNLSAQNAQGKDALLPTYLNANAQAGQEFQDKNAYDRQQYDRQLREKAALTQAGNTNEYNALDTGASVLSAYLNPKHVTTDLSNQGVGNAKPLPSVFSSTAAPAPTQSPYTDSQSNQVPAYTNWKNLYSRYPTT
jgi:hypothetical protein